MLEIVYIYVCIYKHIYQNTFFLVPTCTVNYSNSCFLNALVSAFFQLPDDFWMQLRSAHANDESADELRFAMLELVEGEQRGDGRVDVDNLRRFLHSAMSESDTIGRFDPISITGPDSSLLALRAIMFIMQSGGLTTLFDQFGFLIEQQYVCTECQTSYDVNKDNVETIFMIRGRGHHGRSKSWNEIVTASSHVNGLMCRGPCNKKHNHAVCFCFCSFF